MKSAKEKMPQNPSAILKYALHHFKQECQERNLEFTPDFARNFIYLLARDRYDGLNLKVLVTDCHMRQFLEKAIKMFSNPLDPTISNMKLVSYLSNTKELQLAFVRKKYEENFKREIQTLLDDILKYPENSNKKQIEEMLAKMHSFIVASYCLGSPKNHVLLQQTRQSLMSVIGFEDLQNYVMKKKYHRLEYLQRLSATVSGILIHNNSGPDGEKENMRDIFAELDLAYANTKESIEKEKERVENCKANGEEFMESCILIDVERNMVCSDWHLARLRTVNKYLVLFNTYAYQLDAFSNVVEKTEYLVSTGKKKLNCVVEKINNILKYRRAIESELIFPHFVYLSEVWCELVVYLHHLNELQRIKDTMNTYVSAEIEQAFLQSMDNVVAHKQYSKYPIETPMAKVIALINERPTSGNFLKLCSKDIKKYCCLTLVLTGGMLVPATVQRQLCENLQIKFGFHNIELTKYAERNFEEFLRIFNSVVYSSLDLIMFLRLEDEILQQMITEEPVVEPKQKSFQTQTEMVVVNDLSVPNQINVTWNAWDFHRETIHLAAQRKTQTHSTQTVNSFGQRAAQNQAYYTRKHF